MDESMATGDLEPADTSWRSELSDEDMRDTYPELWNQVKDEKP